MKSKVQVTKESQGYVERPACCGTCKNYYREWVTMPAADKWSKPYEKEKSKRCVIGLFAVMKSAHCNLYERAK